MTSAADAAQLQASDPKVSAFVAASAGSGKTKLLTDRLLRLMLAGADPARIQCLTFTKAAAAEMAIRLQTRLSVWVTAPSETLDAELRALDYAKPDDALREKARKLFAQVLDLPGGMRIGTIHAFCQSLLRRFPLEARLSPHFDLLQEIDAEAALRESMEAMLAGAHTPERRDALTALAGLVSLDGFRHLVTRLDADRDRLRNVINLQPNRMSAALDRVTGARRDATVADAVAWVGEDTLRKAAVALAANGSPSTAEAGQKMLDWLGLRAEDRAECWPQWRDIFVRPDGTPRGMGALVNKKLAGTHPHLAEIFSREQARIDAFEDFARARVVADVSGALLRLAEPVIDLFDQRKEQAEKLDFSDLIGRTGALLVDPGAAWVLYKLDGGLDHLLLDEVQDTAPAQWAIAGALTAEFFSGAGARENTRRTVFAVGDPKQSIYSFQGADPHAFEHWRGVLKRRVEDAGERWEDVPMNVSFRSTAPVLALVDAVFDDPVAAAGVTEGQKLAHRAHREGQSGAVELWPLAPRPDAAAPEPWRVPDKNLGGTSAPQRLADALAEWIKSQTDGSIKLESRGRALAPGDILVLVRRRNDFARALMRALKQLDVPVAGMDRMMLTEQPAVADLLALCDALLLPEDDLQFACLLTSPLGGLSDDGLMRLAIGREGTLWRELQRRSGEHADWAAAEQFFSTLLARVDYVTPHALLVEALGPLGGRARLLARLGPEAAEPVDELLGAAIAYAESHPPSLQGFLHWLRQSGAEVKREAEGAGHVVRIMTVHGAKGLQAPLVILPDTTTIPRDEGTLLWADDPDSDAALPIWSPRKELRCAAVDRLRQEAHDRQMAEYNRLLYVALTRAEDRLVVCGWQTHHAHPPESWYELVRRGFARLPGVTAEPFAAVANPWSGEAMRHAAPQTAPVVARAAALPAGAEKTPLPAWAGQAPFWLAGELPPEPAVPTPLAPSRPQDSDLGPVPHAASPLASRDASGSRFRRGKLVHALLQHLPDIPAAERAAAAQTYLRRPGAMIPPGEVPALLADILAVLENPALAPLFGPDGRAEVPLTGVASGMVVGGLVDRLAVLPDRVLVADYKTNRLPPADVDSVPVLYLRQMAAYRAVLRGAFPGRAIHCALVWTTGARATVLPDSLLDRHAPGAMVAA